MIPVLAGLPANTRAARAPQPKRPRALIICQFSPFPVVTGGYERMIAELHESILPKHEVWFLWNRQKDGSTRLYRQGELVHLNPGLRDLRALEFEFALFINPLAIDREPELALADDVPSFYFVDRYRRSTRDSRFQGALAYSTRDPDDDVLIIGGWFDPAVFRPARIAEDRIVSVARVAAVKNPAALVRGYRERIYARFGLPLWLVGGPDPPSEWALVASYVDGESICSTTDPNDLRATHNWLTGRDIAAMLNRARLWVNAAPLESFCMSLVEAMACGTTCVVNGLYDGFDPAALRPHVHGPIDGPKGDLLDLIEEALEQDIRIDASRFAQQFTSGEVRQRLGTYIERQLAATPPTR